jgi:hemerythrin-like domain-containing protein
MPRAGALLSLSREHHAALVLARTALRAAEAADAGETDAGRAAISEVEAHWDAVMSAHFEREERLIQLARDALDAGLAQQVMAEHAELRMLAGGSCDLELADRLRRFANLLKAHVRYEERVLFPQLQAHASAGNAGKQEA